MVVEGHGMGNDYNSDGYQYHYHEWWGWWLLLLNSASNEGGSSGVVTAVVVKTVNLAHECHFNCQYMLMCD